MLERVAEVDPLDMGTMDRLVRIDEDLDGPEKAYSRMLSGLDRFPDSFALRCMVVTWLRQNMPNRADHPFEELHAKYPGDSWVMAEMALLRLHQHHWHEAAELARQAIALEPKYSRHWSILGKCELELGEFEKAKTSLRKSVECNVDDTFAMRSLLDLYPAGTQRRELIDFVYGELCKQTTYGEGISGFYDLAIGRIPYDELEEKLQHACQQRPDLPQSWSCLTDLLSRLHRLDEAIATGRKATDAFPLHVQAWIDLAIVYRAAGKPDDELASLEQARSVSGNDASVAKQLSEFYRSQKQFKDADTVLKRGLESNPRDAELLAFRADNLWDLAEHDQAIDTISKAIEIVPHYDWAWDKLSVWSKEARQKDACQVLAHRLIEARPKNVRGYLRLADAHRENFELQRAMQAIERALEIDPRKIDAHRAKTWILSTSGQFQGAIAATSPEVFRESPSPPLLLTRSDLHYSQGETQQAIQTLQNAVELDPDNYLGWRKLMYWTERLEEIPALARGSEPHAAEYYVLDPSKVSKSNTQERFFVDGRRCVFEQPSSVRTSHPVDQALEVVTGPFSAWTTLSRDCRSVANGSACRRQTVD
ncbi:MAG: tetratricopeptide repeat protein [Pirellula sp.]